MDEFALIRRLTAGRADAAKHPGVAVGVGDDAAVVEAAPGKQIVLTCDTMVETVHFLPWTMRDEDTGWKAMASNISDLAAMGAEPLYALAAISVPQGFPVERLERLYEGLYACAKEYGVAVVGGDTTSSPHELVVTVTAVGSVERERALLRSGARPGDVVFVTGPLGLSSAGLDYLMRRRLPAAEAVAAAGSEYAALVAAHQRPRPQVAAGRVLALSVGLAHALNDVSDGLASEAWEIAEASGVRIVLDEAALPVHDALAAYCSSAGAGSDADASAGMGAGAGAGGKSALEFILYGGEDYQLVGTAPRERADALLAALAGAGCEAAIVGEVRSGDAGVELARRDGRLEPIAKRGYNHFG
ncbi:thiamine-phosphate kinase [Paenibacillus thermotolerans]|uniref:thiamine-phosphate kinase n=1 Tax=Paenibacillus thermotolerans TaxID=3027807 RepID=UPI0023ED64D2|nr:thiamine-phosphate kinase [Paenibacillus sp. YIM B05601]